MAFKVKIVQSTVDENLHYAPLSLWVNDAEGDVYVLKRCINVGVPQVEWQAVRLFKDGVWTDRMVMPKRAVAGLTRLNKGDKVVIEVES